jgi:DNA-directed RNA polymerase subunit RPC12/RpoP
MEETAERCLKCGKEQGLQGVAVTIGRKTFHLFYLCSKCGDITVEELLGMMRSYEEKKTI